jgi:ADP-heptose:LPS heptosyltransferase
MQARYYEKAYEELRLQSDWNQQNLPPGAREHRITALPALSPRASIVIFKPDEIGDAVCSLPAIKELRKVYPDAKLVVICQPKCVDIFQRTGLLNGVYPWEPRVVAGRFAFGDPSRVLPEELRRPEVAIFLRTYPMYFTCFTKINARIRIHPRDPRMPSTSMHQPFIDLWGKVRAHQSVQMLQIVSVLTGKVYDDRGVPFPKFQWEDEDKRAPEIVFGEGKVPSSYFVVHPFADFETRRYPMEYWPPLLAAIRKRFQIPIVVIGGPADSGIEFSEGIYSAVGKLKLAQTAYLISRARAYVGNLSGPAHLSAALGIPTVTLMSGHSLPSEWAPWGQTLLLRIDVPCAPCHLRSCYQYGLRCLKELTPSRIFPEVEKFLDAASKPPHRGVRSKLRHAISLSP